MKIDFAEVTEISGDEVSREQVQRLCNRYYWAGASCKGKEVLEAACGSGQGLGYLASLAKRVVGGDFSERLIEIARGHYGNRVELRQFDAQQLPFEDGSFDVILLFEAIYYLPRPEAFFAEARRVLRPGGSLLIATANKDLYDFNPSPHSHRYLGVVEFHEDLGKQGFRVECFGGTPIDELSLLQKTLRPIKRMAVAAGLIPKSMAGKKLLKRLVFGGLVKMPHEIDGTSCRYEPPKALPPNEPDRKHKVIYCIAHRG